MCLYFKLLVACVAPNYPGWIITLLNLIILLNHCDVWRLTTAMDTGWAIESWFHLCTFHVWNLIYYGIQLFLKQFLQTKHTFSDCEC